MKLMRELNDDEIIQLAKDNWVLELPQDAIALVRACFDAAWIKQQADK